MYWIGRGHQETQEWDKAIGSYEKITRDKSGRFYAMGVERIAFCLYKKGEDKKAADISYRLMREKEDHSMPEDAYRWVAEYYFTNGLNEESLDVLRIYEGKYPDAGVGALVAYMKGENLRKLGKSGEAEGYFKKIIKDKASSPYLERAYLGLGRCYLEKGDNEEALSAFEEALRSHEDNMTGAYARFETGNARYAMGDYEAAAKAYMMVAILYGDPQLAPRSLFKAGESFDKAGMTDKSGEMFSELLEKYPDSPEAEQVSQRSRKMQVPTDNE